MSKFKKFTQLKKNSKEEVDALYEILGIDRKDKNIEKTNPDIPRIAELLEWNAEIEALEEGKASGHTLRVAYLSKKMAEELGLDDDEVKNIYLGALFHDTGKHLISPKILSKPGPLTDEEYEIVKTHVTLAIDLVEDVVPVESLAIIRGHHERMDGSGYPDGIAPTNIGIKILGLVDSYDAMTSNRVYNIPKSKDVTFQELEWCTVPREKGGMGYLYDPKLVEILKKIVEE